MPVGTFGSHNNERKGPCHCICDQVEGRQDRDGALSPYIGIWSSPKTISRGIDREIVRPLPIDSDRRMSALSRSTVRIVRPLPVG